MDGLIAERKRIEAELEANSSFLKSVSGETIRFVVEVEEPHPQYTSICNDSRELGWTSPSLILRDFPGLTLMCTRFAMPGLPFEV